MPAHFLSWQGLAFQDDSDESDYNFMWLINLRCEDDVKFSNGIKQKTNKHKSAEMQNEMVKVMALRVLREIVEDLESTSFFTVMVDETTDDASSMEQVVICLRWVSESFELH